MPVKQLVFDILIGENRRNYLVKEDFDIVFDAIFEKHAYLIFLKELPAVRNAYKATVLARIFNENDF